MINQPSSRSDFLCTQRAANWQGVSSQHRRSVTETLADVFLYASEKTENIVALSKLRSMFGTVTTASQWDLNSLRSPCGAFTLASLIHMLTPKGVTINIKTPYSAAFDLRGSWQGVRNVEAQRRLSFLFRTLWMDEIPTPPIHNFNTLLFRAQDQLKTAIIVFQEFTKSIVQRLGQA